MGDLSYINFIGRITLWVAAGLTLVTGYAYLKASIVHLTNQES